VFTVRNPAGRKA